MSTIQWKGRRIASPPGMQWKCSLDAKLSPDAMLGHIEIEVFNSANAGSSGLVQIGNGKRLLHTMQLEPCMTDDDARLSAIIEARRILGRERAAASQICKIMDREIQGRTAE